MPGNGDDILYDFRQVTQNQVDVTTQLADDVAAGREPRPDFVVWPENSTAVDPFRDQQTNAGILAASSAIGVPILVGAIVDAGPTHVLNQGIVWDPVTGAGDRYTKHHPVVFGEYIPFRRYLDSLQIGRLTMVGRDMVAGTRLEPLRIAGVEVADSICFDVAYDDAIYDQVSRGAQLLSRADQQRHLHPHRPDRPAVRDHPAARDRDRPLAGRRLDQRRLRRRSRPTAASSPAPSRGPRPRWSRPSGWTRRSRRRSGSGPGRVGCCIVLTGRRSVARAGPVSSDAHPAAGRGRAGAVRPRRRQREQERVSRRHR